MQITPELIHGVKIAASMAQNLMGGADRLITKGEQLQSQNNAQEIEAAVEKTEMKGLKNAVCAMLDSGVTYETAVDKIKKFWNLTDKEARDVASAVKTIDYPVVTLKYYLQSQGWTSEQISRFIKKSNVRKLLRQDMTHELFKLAPERLYDFLCENI